MTQFIFVDPLWMDVLFQVHLQEPLGALELLSELLAANEALMKIHVTRNLIENFLFQRIKDSGPQVIEEFYSKT